MNYKEATEYFNTLPEAEKYFICTCANWEIYALTNKGKILTNRQRRNKYTAAINNYAKSHGYEQRDIAKLKKTRGRPGIQVRYIPDGRVFASMLQASLATGVPVATVSLHTHGRVRAKFRKFEILEEVGE